MTNAHYSVSHFSTLTKVSSKTSIKSTTKIQALPKEVWMDKFETAKCFRCDELYSFDDSSTRPLPKSKVFKSEISKLNKSNILPYKDEAKQALKVEIKSHIEKKESWVNSQDYRKQMVTIFKEKSF